MRLLVALTLSFRAVVELQIGSAVLAFRHIVDHDPDWAIPHVAGLDEGGAAASSHIHLRPLLLVFVLPPAPYGGGRFANIDRAQPMPSQRGFEQRPHRLNAVGAGRGRE